jgi:hypothetical protein
VKGKRQKLFSLKKQIPPNKTITPPGTTEGILTIYYDPMEPVGIRNEAEERIIKSDEMYHLKGFITRTFIDKDGIEKLQSIQTFGGVHPNVDYETGVFCMPDYMKAKPVSENLIHDIRIVLRVWNLLSCFFVPGKNQYESVKV